MQLLNFLNFTLTNIHACLETQTCIVWIKTLAIHVCWFSQLILNSILCFLLWNAVEGQTFTSFHNYSKTNKYSLQIFYYDFLSIVSCFLANVYNAKESVNSSWSIFSIKLKLWLFLLLSNDIYIYTTESNLVSTKVKKIFLLRGKFLPIWKLTCDP